MKLLTGGKSGSQRQNLFQLTCVVHARDPLQDYLNFSAEHDVPNQNIELLGKHLGSDGNLWVTLPDNVERDITPYIPGENYYSFMPGQQKYHLYIGLSTSTTNANLETDTPEVCVGQAVTLAADWLGGNTPPAEADIRWHLPAKYVNQQTNYSATCSTYVQNADALTNRLQQCWYVNLPGGGCGVREDLQFANGQTATVMAAGRFTVYRPSVNPIVTHGSSGAAIYTNDYPNLLWLDGGPMNFDISISSKYHGNFGLSQLVKFTSESGFFPTSFHSTYGDYYLDGSEYYDGLHDITITANIFDTPGQGIESRQNFASYNGDWKDYVRFTPNGGIPVTLGRIDWSWAATADKTIDWSIVSDGVDGPTLHDDDSFPVWSHVRPSADPADQ